MSTRARARYFNTSAPAGSARTGLIFPPPAGDGSILADQQPAFIFSGANLLAHTPATYIFQVKYTSPEHNYYYTNFFWSGAFGLDFGADNGYYGCHPYPYPPPDSTTKHWEVSTNFDDYNKTGDQIAEDITFGTWYTQAVIVSGTSTRPIIKYYPRLNVDTSFVIFDWGTGARDFSIAGTSVLIFGDNPWSATPSESMDGTFRALQIYSTNHSLANVQAAAALDTNTAVLSLGLSNLHYLNMNPTPTDITDKSGAGHHPTWQNAQRPTLYTA